MCGWPGKPSCSAQEEQRFGETLVHACSSSPAIPALSQLFIFCWLCTHHDMTHAGGDGFIIVSGWQPESLSVRELSLTPWGCLVTPKCQGTGVTTSNERVPSLYFSKLRTTPLCFLSDCLSGFCFATILFYSPGWPWLQGLPASASWLLWLQECSVASGEFCEFWRTLSWALAAQLMARASKWSCHLIVPYVFIVLLL